MFFLVVCKGVFYFWIVRWNSFSKRNCIERFIFFLKNRVYFQSNIALQWFFISTKFLFSGITTALKMILIFSFRLQMPLMTVGRWLKKDTKLIFFTIFATPKIVPSMQLRGLNQIKLYFVKISIFWIYLAQLMRNRENIWFFIIFFISNPPETNRHFSSICAPGCKFLSI